MFGSILEKILRFNALKWKNGKVLLWNMPSLITALYVLVYQHATIEKLYGKQAVIDVFYNLGKFQAKQAFKLVERRFGYGKKLDKINLLHFNTSWAEFIGIGKFKWVKTDTKSNVFILQGKSAIAQEYKKFFGVQKDNFVDHYIRGQAAALIEEITKIPMSCIETKCIAAGHPICTFIIKPTSELNTHQLFKSQEPKRRCHEFSHLGALKDVYFAASNTNHI